MGRRVNAGSDTITDFTDCSDVISLSKGLTFGQIPITASGGEPFSAQLFPQTTQATRE